jgi:epoxide hydrolase-like predicted phosphatase
VTIHAVVFDYGGTLTEPYRTAFRPEYYEERGLDMLALREVLAPLLGHDGDAADVLAHRCERGEVELSEMVAALEARVPGAGALFDPKDSPFSVLELNPDMVALAGDVRRAGLKVGVLSNIFQGMDGGYQLDPDEWDAIVLSCRVGMRKPNPAVYRHVCELIGVAPREVLYLDDFEAMCAGASAVGMTAIRVRDPKAAVAEARGLLGLPATTAGGSLR